MNWKSASLLYIVGLGLAAGPALAKPAKKTSGALDSLKLIQGDEKGNELRSLKAELLVSDSEEKALSQLQHLIRKYRGTPLEADLYFRLAELYMRRSKTDRFFEINRESETIVHLAAEKVHEAKIRNSVEKAVETYGLIQKKFADFSQMDLVIYNHAFACQMLSKNEDAEKLYWKLIKDFSSSPLVPDAHLAIGEIAFDRGQFPLALDHFNAIKAYPESRVYPYGLYKAAWTYYNMRDAEKGLRKLEEVVAYGRFVAQNNIESRLDLRKEALDDMTLFYEDVYPSKDAYKYFREQAGKEDVGHVVLKLAKLYDRHSRFDDERTVLNEFVNQLPDSPLLPQVHTDLVLAQDHLRHKDQAVARLEDFAKICAPDSYWVHHTTKTPEEAKKAAADCTATLNETALRMAGKWLKAWKKLPADTTYADASEKAFAIYLRTPGSGEEYAKSRFAYAELLFARSKFRQASVEYAAVTPVTKDAQLIHDSSYGALIALQKAVGDKWSDADEKSFHDLAQVYLTKNPKGKYRLDIEYKMALLAYEKERYDECAPQFLRLGRQYPNDDKGVKSQDLYLDILNIKKDYAQIRNYTQELLKLHPNPERTAKMHKLYEQAYFLQVQGLEEKGDLKGALSGYQAFAKQNPSSDLTEKAMWNSMLLQFKLGDAHSGAKAAEDFATKFPHSDQAVNALLRAAQTFEQMAQLGEAAHVLEKLVVADAKSAARWKELAADFYTLDGQTGSARRLYNELKASSEGDKRLALYNKLEALEKNYGSEQSHAEIIKTMVDHGIQPYANQWRVSLVEKTYDNGKNTEAFNEAKRMLGSSMGAAEKARLRLVQAKILEQEFMKQSVKSHAERVATVLALKTEKLEKAQEAFQSAIKYGDPHVSMEAFEHLYGCYAAYVKALKEMPTPAGLGPEDEKVFRAEIDKLVIPLEEKSVDTLAQAVAFARKQSFLDGTAARLQTQLDDLNQQLRSHLAPEIQKPEMVLPEVSHG